MEFKYKDADFYNAYCEQLEDFILLEYFEDMKENMSGYYAFSEINFIYLPLKLAC